MNHPAEALAGKKVLVTGATGFIGTHLCQTLARHGAKVHAVTRSRTPYSAPGLVWHHVDLTALDATEACLSRVRADVVFELCSHAHGERDLSLVAATFRGELLSTIHVLTALAKVGCARAVLAGSMEEPRAGDTPSSPYAAAKAASRLYADLFHHEYKVPVVMPRIFMTYGPGQAAKKFVAYCTRAMLAGEPVHIRAPQRSADWVFVHDVVDGLIHTAVATEVEGRTMDLGTGQLTTLLEVARIIQELTCSTSEIHADAAATATPPGREADVVATRKFVGWSANTPLVNGLMQTVRHELGRMGHPSVDNLRPAGDAAARLREPRDTGTPGVVQAAVGLGGLLSTLADPLAILARAL